MNVTPQKSSLNRSIVSPQSVDEKHLHLIEKFLKDLEQLVKNLVELQAEKPEVVFSDDCPELQKLCFKLEFLIQFKLKEKKSFFDSSLSVSNNSGDGSKNLISTYSSKDYWSFFLEGLKASRGFQDAIKYVKGISDIKTNIGRGRAFIRFCLEYHRLADAIQQIMMEEKILNNWYNEKAVWYNESQKVRIFQLLYDLNDINFELLSKSNFELDSSWPSISVNNPNSGKIQITRHRTNSITSYTSYYQEKDSIDQLSSTPLEMDNEFLISKMNQSMNPQDIDNKSIDIHSTYQMELENQETKIAELTQKLSVKDSQLEALFDEMKKKNSLSEWTRNDTNSEQKADVSSSNDNDSTIFLEKMAAQIQSLNEQLNTKVSQNIELNNCLIKQTNLCENLSNVLATNQEKLTQLDSEREKNLEMIEKLQCDFDILNKDYNELKMEFNTKSGKEESLIKETLSQTESIISLKQICSKQEAHINQLKIELDLIRDNRQKEIDSQSREAQQNLVKIQLKEEENYLLNDQIQKLSGSLSEERKEKENLEKDIANLKENFDKINRKSQNKIDQLEDDNNEIKKRLVKLIKEKAELWQKADNLEYENLLKVNAMWTEDSNVTHCLTCNSGFSLLLRKHHCRICLKIFCYYCCNNWIDYNNSKLRVCQRCFESKSQLNQNIPRISTKENSVQEFLTNKDDKMKQLGIESITSSNSKDGVDEDESDPDINFEVRSEKLNLCIEKVSVSAFNSACQSSKEVGQSIYQTSNPGNPFEPEPESLNPFETNSNPFETDIYGKKEEIIKEACEQINEQKNIPHSPNFSMNELTSIYSDEGSDLIVRKKRILKKKKRSPNNILTCISDEKQTHDRSINADESFTILSQDEIDKA